MATSKPFVSTDKLKGRKNYREWCFDIQNVLVTETVWAVVNGYPAGDKTSVSLKKLKNQLPEEI
jgi:hypothetical protein